MGIISFLLLVIVFWFFYNFLVKVALPIYRTTTQLKRQFKNMAEQPHGQANTTNIPKTDTPQEKVGEYIDFEEIK